MATFHCPHVSCLSYLCVECKDAHTINADTDSHRVESLRRMTEGNITPNLRSDDRLCEKHRQKCDMYCKTCNDLICVRCSRVEPHRRHTITDITEELCQALRKELCLLEERVTYLLSQVNDALERVDRQIAKVKNNSRQSRETIHRDFDDMQRQLKARHEALLQEVYTTEREKTTALTAQRDKLAKAAAQLGGFRGNVNKVVKNRTVVDHFALKAAAKQHAHHLASYEGTLDLCPVRDDTIAYVQKGCTRVQSSIREFGQLKHSKFDLWKFFGMTP